MKTCCRILIALAVAWSGLFSQQSVISFESDRWQMVDAEQKEFAGRNCLMGIARLKDAEFENGVIEFDLAVTGERSYPGIMFRVQKEGEYERIYARPHLTRSFQNVVQYEGTFNGLDSWQLYNGPGKTASATFPHNEWFHVRIDVKGTQARLFIGNAARPTLFIRDLAHGISKGTIGVWGPKDGSAFFSNFSYRNDDGLQFPEPVRSDAPLGVIMDWELSEPVRASDADLEELPESQGITNLRWQKINSLPSGLVDVSRYFSRLSPVTDIIWAKTVIESEKAGTKTYAFGYSDYIAIFLNGKLLFTGNSAYQSRDPSFQGIIGLNDNISLPMAKGRNELLIAVAETFGGWGFIFQDVDAIYLHPSLVKQWEIARKFRYPESVAYDSKRDVLYVSNFTYEGAGFISKVKTDGRIEELNWVTGVIRPTGMCMVGDRLFVVGRLNLIEIDPESKAIVKRYAFPQPVFPNDVDADPQGNLYITDGGKGVVYRFSNGQIEEWISNEQLRGANGILAEAGRILVGASAEGSVKTIDLRTKELRTFFSLAPGVIMDGLRKDGKGNYLVGDNAGRIFRVTPRGESTLLLDTRPRQIVCADYEYIAAKHMLVVPTLGDNRLMMYTMEE